MELSQEEFDDLLGWPCRMFFVCFLVNVARAFLSFASWTSFADATAKNKIL
jgi:hypothetical protein